MSVKEKPRIRQTLIDNGHPYFITCATVSGLPLFVSPQIVSILLRTLERMQQSERFSVHAYVILENHLHLVARSPDPLKEIGAFKSRVARLIVRHLMQVQAGKLLHSLYNRRMQYTTSRNYQIWQEGSMPEALPDSSVLHERIDYIHQNPVQRGYVDQPIHWRYSSARNYAGMKGLLEVNTNIIER